MRLFLFALIAIWCAQLGYAASNPQTDAVIKGIFAERPLFSGAVYYRYQGQENWLYHGEARKGVDVGPDTNFVIGSLTKHITSYIVIDLIKEGKLAVDSTLADVFELDEKGKAYGSIQISELMDHRSGLSGGSCPLMDNINAMLACSSFNPVKTGSFAYSNFGYRVLGKVIEKITGQSYGEVLKERVLEPNGLEHSGYVPNANTAAGTVATLLGNVHHNPLDTIAPNVVTQNDLAVGMLYFSLPDLAKWLTSLKDDPRHAFYRETLGTADDQAYRFGWNTETVLGEPRTEHGGSMIGFSSRAFWNDDAIVIVMQNNDKKSLIRVSDAVLGAVLGKCTDATGCLDFESTKDNVIDAALRQVYMVAIPAVFFVILLIVYIPRIYFRGDRSRIAVTTVESILMASPFAYKSLDDAYPIVFTAIILALLAWKWTRTGHAERTGRYRLIMAIKVLVVILLAGLHIAAATDWQPF